MKAECHGLHESMVGCPGGMLEGYGMIWLPYGEVWYGMINNWYGYYGMVSIWYG